MGIILTTIAIIYLTVFAIIVILSIPYLIASGKMFKDHGENALFIFIPVYSTYKRYCIAKCKKEFTIILYTCFSYFGFTIIASLIAGNTNVHDIIVTLAEYIAIIIALVCSAQYSVRISRHYNRSSYFGIGVFFLPFIFVPIMVFKDKRIPPIKEDEQTNEHKNMEEIKEEKECDTKKSEKDMKKKKSFISNYDFTLLKTEIEGYGFSYSFKQFALQCAMIFAITGAVAFISKLSLYSFAVLGIIATGAVPFIIRAQVIQTYQIQRFDMVKTYLDNVIPVFMNNPVTTTTWSHVLDLLSGKMKECVEKALDYVMNNTSDTNALNTAFTFIEDEFPNSRIHAVHQLMNTIENENSKNYHEAVKTTFDDTDRWIERTFGFQSDLKDKRNKMMMLCVMTMLANCLFIAVYSSNEIFASFTDMLLYQISTTIFIAILLTMMCLFYIKLNGVWMINDRTEKLQEKYHKAFIDYTQKPKTRPGKSEIIACVLALTLAVFAHIKLDKMIITIMIAAFGIYFLFANYLRRKNARKTLQRALQIEFPMWLREVALNLQNFTVMNAISNSRTNSSEIMCYYIDRFIDDVSEDPTRIKPYSEFLNEFDLPDARSSMKMLYTLQDLTDEQLQRQTNSLIKRNQTNLAKSEILKNEDSINGINKFGFLPVALFMIQMVISMILLFVFLMQYMNGAMTI